MNDGIGGTAADGPLLKTTRLILRAGQGVVIAIGVILALVVAVLPFHWETTTVELAAAVGRPVPGQALWAIIALFASILVVLAAVFAMFGKLHAIVADVARGEAFTTANVARLRWLAWALLGVQLWGLVTESLGYWAGSLLRETNVDVSLSLTGLLGILVAFVLAKVFEAGVRMREDLEGTV